MRHGIAEDMPPSGKDRDRALTDEGIEKTRLTGKALKNLDVEIRMMLTSPYKRAIQTAEIIAEELGCKQLKELPELRAGGSSTTLVQALQHLHGHAPSVMLVGHEPDLSRLISLLLSGGEEIAVTMKKGGICKLHCLRIAPGEARLEWMLAPKHLVRMA